MQGLQSNIWRQEGGVRATMSPNASASASARAQCRVRIILIRHQVDVSPAVIDIAVNSHIVRISPSNTAPDFTTYPADGFYYRTVPSDTLQGKAMAKLANERGYANASTRTLNNH